MRSPMTNADIKSTELEPNEELRVEIQQFAEMNDCKM